MGAGATERGGQGGGFPAPRTSGRDPSTGGGGGGVGSRAPVQTRPRPGPWPGSRLSARRPTGPSPPLRVAGRRQKVCVFRGLSSGESPPPPAAPTPLPP